MLKIVDGKTPVYLTIQHNDGLVVKMGRGALRYFISPDDGLICFDPFHGTGHCRFHARNITDIVDICESHIVTVDYRNTYTGEPQFDRVEFPQDLNNLDLNYVNVLFKNGERVSVFQDDCEWTVEITYNNKATHYVVYPIGGQNE